MGSSASALAKARSTISREKKVGKQTTPLAHCTSTTPPLRNTDEENSQAGCDTLNLETTQLYNVNIVEESGLLVREPRKRKRNFIHAAKAGDVEGVKELIKYHKAKLLEKIDEQVENSPENTDLESNLDINARGMWGNTPLILACQYGYEEIALLLLSEGADFNVCNEKGARPLLYSCIEGLTGVVVELVGRGDIIETEPVHLYNQHTDSSQRLTPFLSAAINGFYQITEVLIAKGAMLDRRVVPKVKKGDSFQPCLSEPGGMTPLMGATKHNRSEVVKLLLKHGADISPLNHEGADVFFEACRDGAFEVATLFLEHASSPELRKLMADGHISNAEACATRPLHLACQKRAAGFVPLLISAGAQINCLDAKHATPLHYAAQFGLETTVQALLEAGADPSLLDKHGRTAAQLAQKTKNAASISEILRLGSNLHTSQSPQINNLSFISVQDNGEQPGDIEQENNAEVWSQDSSVSVFNESPQACLTGQPASTTNTEFLYPQTSSTIQENPSDRTVLLQQNPDKILRFSGSKQKDCESGTRKVSFVS